MCLQTFLRQASKKGVNKYFVFFKNEEGEMKNICFQDYTFFCLEENRKVRFLNPLRVIETLNKIRNRELKVVGTGQYNENIDFKNNYNRKGAIN